MKRFRTILILVLSTITSIMAGDSYSYEIYYISGVFKSGSVTYRANGYKTENRRLVRVSFISAAYNTPSPYFRYSIKFKDVGKVKIIIYKNGKQYRWKYLTSKQLKGKLK
jgi:hypothetical protein